MKNEKKFFFYLFSSLEMDEMENMQH